MEIATRLSEELSRYMDLSTRQIELTTANMANIDTPGYRAVAMDFEGEMQRAMGAVDSTDHALALAAHPELVAEAGLVVRPDGNNVSMDRESMTLAEAQLRFKTGVAILRREYTRVFDAIHASS